MKKIHINIIFLAALLTFAGCHIHDPYEPHYVDYDPPQPPAGIVMINGDERVDLYWNHNRESDVAGYNVYFNYEYDGKYTLIGSTEDNSFIDWGVYNGTTYYYAVTAYDYNGNESELSYDIIYATPRPEGFNQAIFEYGEFPDLAGYDLSTYSVVPFDDESADFFFEFYEGNYYLSTWLFGDTKIRDMGPTIDIFDIPFAPDYGWSEEDAEVAVVGHTYVIWTWDNHFAKVRIKNIVGDRVVFDWAYQLVEGDPQLKPKTSNGKRSPFNKEKLLQRTRSE
jgi:hypothetical protein